MLHNDRLQGILFDQPELIDLIHRTRKDRFIQRVLATKKTLQNWHPQSTAHKIFNRHNNHSYDTDPSHEYVIPAGLSKKAYNERMEDLLQRLNLR